MKRGICKPLIIAAGAFCLLVAGTASAQPKPAAPDDFSKAMDAYLSNDENVEKVGNALRRFFQKKEQEARANAEKAEKDKLEDQFRNPVKIDIGGSPVKGPENAKVTIIEFSEFQCPYCKRGAATVDEVMKAYPTQVKVAFKHFPLPFHQQAGPAAAAAIAAQKQGKFWEMHDKLFANQQDLTEAAFLNAARELGLNVDKFKADMSDPATMKMVEDDKALGEKVGIRGTPGFFINGVMLSGAQPISAFKPIIDRWLEQTK